MNEGFDWDAFQRLHTRVGVSAQGVPVFLATFLCFPVDSWEEEGRLMPSIFHLSSLDLAAAPKEGTSVLSSAQHQGCVILLTAPRFLPGTILTHSQWIGRG